MSEKYAYFVGINRYANPINNLYGCENDVNELCKVVMNTFDFNESNVKIDLSEYATQDKITSTLLSFITNLCADDLFLFYYSGHGSQIFDIDKDEDDDSFDEMICPFNVSWLSPLTDDFIRFIFDQAVPGAKIISIFDCCHSGTITRSLKHEDLKVRFIPNPHIETREAQKQSRQIILKDNQIVLSACQSYESALEYKIHGKIRGAFTYHLINGINEGCSTYYDIYSYVYDHIEDQTPNLEGSDTMIKEKLFS